MDGAHPPRRLEGRTCLIVGGTGGIGLATARRFLSEGARLVVTGLDGGAIAGSADPGPPCDELPLDVRDPGAVRDVFRRALEFFGGRLDALFHVAGISGRRFGDGPLHDCTDEGWDRVTEVNARGVFLTNREAVRIMRDQAIDGSGLRGTVVNVGSVLAESPAPDHFGTVAYAASKGAIRSLTLTAAALYASDRIRFNLIEPGLIETPMSTRATGDPTIRTYLAARQPMAGGPGTAEDVAEAALFLAEPASRFVTGAILNVDGGWRVSDGRRPGAPP